MAMDEKTLRKGERYYRSGKVLWVVKHGSKLFSKVLGTYPYYVELDLETGGNGCTCPLGGDCKHVAAVMKAHEKGFYFETFEGHAELFPEAVAMEFLSEVPELALDVTLKELRFAVSTDESGSEVARLFRRALKLVALTGRKEALHILREVLDEYVHVFEDYELSKKLEDELRALESSFEKPL
ncbi:SWIM zinc finger family protein [Thermococcus sp.]|uniref:SWIM zinc finger family protein n=1 Tax=Thermococcus sp. TaxID=35749 RepID=UPI00342BC5FB